MRYLLLALTLTLTACDARNTDIVDCDPGEWSAAEGEPTAPVGAVVPFDSQLLAARIGPFPEGAELEAATIGLAPGWGCVEPYSVGAWAGSEAPADDARRWLAPPTWEAPVDLGNGFATRRFGLRESLSVEPGGYAWVGMLLAPVAACGVSVQGPAPGSTWRRREGTWTEEPAPLLARVEGCQPAQLPAFPLPSRECVQAGDCP